jgi:hypothetical protein
MTVNSELASQHLSAGDGLQESGNFDEAIAPYEKILALKIVSFKIPLNFTYWFNSQSSNSFPFNVIYFQAKILKLSLLL